MTEYLILFCLMLLITAHAFLIKGCFGLHQIIPESSRTVASEASRITAVLDEVADLISDLTNGSPSNAIPSPVPSWQEIALTGLISKMGITTEHASPLTEEWTIRQNDSPPTLETENQLDELSS